MEVKNCTIESFGINVFNDAVMRERLPKSTYKAIKKTVEEGTPLTREIADVVANAMKDWAIERGATHFTHWFQPMTGVTAEKHEAFISPTADGRAIAEFSGSELIKGESDASSFPSGGLRATFEARGYTVWDCTSPAFLREDEGGVTLFIPTAFCSYTGEALDKKTPLLRSLEALSKQALRVLRIFGNTSTTRVIPTVGPEQEYFLIDKEHFKKRRDLVYTGRTLFGARPPKGQELDDHYYGSIKERVAAFMKEIDMELWKLGVTAKTKHNEVAPGQFEIASIYNNCNISTDHNQIVMDTLKKIADRHGLSCLLHEKPFAGINGSGKHNNWSMATDDGQNLLEPGKRPQENKQFLIFLGSVIKAIDEYSDLLRVSAANPGNDHRLGANEAPPAIISMFLGEQLLDILKEIEDGEVRNSKHGGELAVGVATFPALNKDVTDRNRTSPFAFTGNKFEFRMVPSSTSISDANVVLNTIVAETLSEIADRLEGADNFEGEINSILKDIIKNHRRIIFNGDGYSKEWVLEAERRGLPNIRSTVEAIPALTTEKAIKLFGKHNVFTSVELHARYEIMLEAYIKQIRLEGYTMLEMARRQITPAVIRYINEIATSINNVKTTGVHAFTEEQEEILKELTEVFTSFRKNIPVLSEMLKELAGFDGYTLEKAVFCRDEIFRVMGELRKDGDRLEVLVAEDVWPFPTYGDLLFFM